MPSKKKPVPIPLDQLRRKPRKGDFVSYWWCPKGTRIVSVRPYDGRYKEWFNWIVELEVPAAKRYRKPTTEVPVPKI